MNDERPDAAPEGPQMTAPDGPARQGTAELTYHALFERLDLQDQVRAVKVTEFRRQSWLSGAQDGDRWAVTLHEGGTFSYGRSFMEAFMRATDASP